jgi:hypothetical protein
VKTRIWATAAAVWALIYLVAYLVGVHKDGNGAVWWYVAAVLVAAALSVPAGFKGPGGRAVQLLLLALMLFVVCALLGGLSLGPLLLPAIIGCVVALKAAQPAAPVSRR